MWKVTVSNQTLLKMFSRTSMAWSTRWLLLSISPPIQRRTPSRNSGALALWDQHKETKWKIFKIIDDHRCTIEKIQNQHSQIRPWTLKPASIPQEFLMSMLLPMLREDSQWSLQLRLLHLSQHILTLKSRLKNFWTKSAKIFYPSSLDQVSFGIQSIASGPCLSSMSASFCIFTMKILGNKCLLVPCSIHSSQLSRPNWKPLVILRLRVLWATWTPKLTKWSWTTIWLPMKPLKNINEQFNTFAQRLLLILFKLKTN